MDKIVSKYEIHSCLMENEQRPNILETMNSGRNAFFKPIPLLTILFQIVYKVVSDYVCARLKTNVEIRLNQINIKLILWWTGFRVVLMIIIHLNYYGHRFDLIVSIFGIIHKNFSIRVIQTQNNSLPLFNRPYS